MKIIEIEAPQKRSSDAQKRWRSNVNMVLSFGEISESFEQKDKPLNIKLSKQTCYDNKSLTLHLKKQADQERESDTES